PESERHRDEVVLARQPLREDALLETVVCPALGQLSADAVAVITEPERAARARHVGTEEEVVAGAHSVAATPIAKHLGDIDDRVVEAPVPRPARRDPGVAVVWGAGGRRIVRADRRPGVRHGAGRHGDEVARERQPRRAPTGFPWGWGARRGSGTTSIDRGAKQVGS